MPEVLVLGQPNENIFPQGNAWRGKSLICLTLCCMGEQADIKFSKDYSALTIFAPHISLETY